MIKRRAVLAGYGYLASLAVIPRALAQSEYPVRPIRLVIPFPPGGATDAIGRPWADKMRSLLGSVFIENQAGAGGMLGTAAFAHAQADGYILAGQGR